VERHTPPRIMLVFIYYQRPVAGPGRRDSIWGHSCGGRPQCIGHVIRAHAQWLQTHCQWLPMGDV